MTSEFFLLASLVLIGIVFFSVFQIYTITQSEETKKAEIKAEAERIASLAYKISKDPSKYMQYCLFTLLSNITVENGLLRYESSKYKFTLIVPKEIENSQLFETTKVCFVKRDSKIVLSREAESCNLNGVCELEECKINCPDCYGPNNNCLNDNFCNLNIGENCKNSLDCSCRTFGQNYVCCPENPSSNKYGCFYLPNKKGKGEECYCDDECSSGLKCNPVDRSFTSYKKACCEEGKVWNGNECIFKRECSYPCSPNCILPSKWDWRDVNGVNYLNPVRNQGICGSCWAFSAIGTVEGVYNVEKDCPACNKDLSEQQLVSNSGECCYFCGDCGGGWPHLALRYIKSKGVSDESCFPYKASNAPCDLCSDWQSRVTKITQYGAISPNMEEIKRAVICKGPLSVASMNWMHAIVLIGYDDERGVWIIRNSWGSNWGDRGYGYIPYAGHPYSDLVNYVYYVEGVSP
jgi:hypothetical protein